MIKPITPVIPFESIELEELEKTNIITLITAFQKWGGGTLISLQRATEVVNGLQHVLMMNKNKRAAVRWMCARRIWGDKFVCKRIIDDIWHIRPNFIKQSRSLAFSELNCMK